MHRAGFNSASRLYANAMNALGMRPAEFRAGGRGATIRFAVGECSLGSILVAATDVGVCAISFGDDPTRLVRSLQDRFSQATLVGADRAFERTVARVVAFVEQPRLGLDLPLDIRGTAFQQRVWKQLMAIPAGSTRTYSQIARALGRPAGSRAVGGACAKNPIAVAIPCHRVLRTDGSLSGYHWGVDRKARLLDRERGRADARRGTGPRPAMPVRSA
jgi:AraC family transcriptional regulator of adaptative response/methylated-DNA-[protein]-cysteine methyltransferase